MSVKENIIKFTKQTYDFTKLLLRRLRLIRLNRNFLVFLVFLCISFSFWWLMTLKETTTYTQEFNVKLTNQPKDVIITSGLPNKIRVSLNCTGLNLVRYKLKNNSYTISLNYNDLEKTGSRLSMNNTALRRLISRYINNSLSISSVYPAQIDMVYTKGKPKVVPIIFKGKVTPGPQYVFCGTELKTEIAEVYAPNELYDSIQCVYTEFQKLDNVEDTIVTRVALSKIPNAKIEPDSVDVTIFVSVFAEKSIQVPILCSNIPRNKVLRFFPSKADVKFNVSMAHYENIKTTDFVIFVDYDKIRKGETHGTLQLGSTPEYVSNVRFKPEKVEFVVETVDE